MASNGFGSHFRMTTWGESHGKAIGVVIDGCPAGIELNESDINEALALRAPGKNDLTSPRKEEDTIEILSGVFEGVTTGAPISLYIQNQDPKSEHYESIKNSLRPGHANFTYLEKYGIFDYRGGGRASARETASRVAAGAVAKKFLSHYGVQVIAYLKKLSDIEVHVLEFNFEKLKDARNQSDLFCTDSEKGLSMAKKVKEAKERGDSLGGLVEFVAFSVPPGLGEPIYDKLDAKLAFAMMSLPASKGFEIGSGFDCVSMKGSEHNDPFILQSGKVETASNYAGGILGGISTGMPIVGRVAFKPTSSIQCAQKTLSLDKEKMAFNLPSGSRHDPCVAIRAVPVVEAMVALVLADCLLLNRSAKR